MRAEGFSRHVILYSKGWYNKSGKGIFADLSKLLAKYSSIDEKDVSLYDVREFLARAYVIHARDAFTNTGDIQLTEWLLDMLGWKWVGSFAHLTRAPEEVMIGALSTTMGETVGDPKSRMDIDLAKTEPLVEQKGIHE